MQKLGSKNEKFYWDYSSFDLDFFKEDVENSLKNNFTTKHSDFQNVFWKLSKTCTKQKKKEDSTTTLL